MGKLLVDEKEIVVPGQVVAEGMDFLPGNGIFREENKLIAAQIGMVNVDNRLVKLIQLTGTYNPKSGDLVIGKIVNISMYGWSVDIGHSNLAVLGMKDATFDFIPREADLTRYYDFDDVIASKIQNVTKLNLIDLTMKGQGLMKLKGGIVIDINPSRVPRIIGRQGSMVTLIKEKTKTKIMVGQNGKIWINGEDVKLLDKAIKAIEMIEMYAHTDGLTERVEKFLEK